MFKVVGPENSENYEKHKKTMKTIPIVSKKSNFRYNHWILMIPIDFGRQSRQGIRWPEHYGNYREHWESIKKKNKLSKYKIYFEKL